MPLVQQLAHEILGRSWATEVRAQTALPSHSLTVNPVKLFGHFKVHGIS
jgi:hypothetical protein